MFTDLKRGACVVVKGMGQATSQTVGHKYGPQAEKVADDSLATAGNTTCVVAVRTRGYYYRGEYHIALYFRGPKTFAFEQFHEMISGMALTS